MRHIPAGPVLLALLLASVAGAPEVRSADPSAEPLEALLPADVLAAVVVREPALFHREFEESALGALLGARSESLGRLPRRWAAARAALERELGVSLKELAAVPRGPLAVTLLSLETDPRPQPTWAVLAEIGDDSAPARRLIARMAAAHAHRPGATSRPTTLGQTPAVLFGPANRPAGAAVLGRHLVISNTRTGLEAALAAVRDGPKKGFLAAEPLRQMRAHLNAEAAGAYGYISPRRLRAALWPTAAKGTSHIDGARLRALLGAAALDSLRMVGFAVSLDRPNSRDRVAVAFDDQKTPFSHRPADGNARELLSMVSARADLGLGVRGDVGRLWDQLDIAMRHSLDPKTYGKVHESLARLTQATGFDLRGDLLAATGAGWVLVGPGAARPPGEPPPGPPRERAQVQYGLIAAIRDRARLLRCLAAFRQFVERQSTPNDADEAPISLKQFKLGEQVVDYLLIPDRPLLSPSIAVTPRHLIVASTTTAMRRILASLGREEESLASDSTFGTLVQQVDADAPAIGAVSVALLTRVLAGAPDGAAPPRLAFVWSAKPAPPGLVFRSYGPVSPTLAAGVALINHLFAPSVPSPPTTLPARPTTTRPAGDGP